jgi:hypothetical protein
MLFMYSSLAVLTRCNGTRGLAKRGFLALFYRVFSSFILRVCILFDAMPVTVHATIYVVILSLYTLHIAVLDTRYAIYRQTP